MGARGGEVPTGVRTCGARRTTCDCRRIKWMTLRCGLAPDVLCMPVEVLMVKKQRVIEEMRRLGFKPARRGNATGHEVWARTDGVMLHPVLRHGSDMHAGHLYCLGQELERQGLLSRRDFERRVRGRA